MALEALEGLKLGVDGFLREILHSELEEDEVPALHRFAPEAEGGLEILFHRLLADTLRVVQDQAKNLGFEQGFDHRQVHGQVGFELIDITAIETQIITNTRTLRMQVLHVRAEAEGLTVVLSTRGHHVGSLHYQVVVVLYSRL